MTTTTTWLGTQLSRQRKRSDAHSNLQSKGLRGTRKGGRSCWNCEFLLWPAIVVTSWPGHPASQPASHLVGDYTVCPNCKISVSKERNQVLRWRWMDNNAGLARSTRSRFPILVFSIRRLYIPQLEQLYQSIRGRLLTRTKSTGSFLPVHFLCVSFSDMWTNEPIMGVRNCFGDTRRYDKPPAKDIRKRLSRKWIENDGIPFNGIWTCECDPTTLYGFTVISIWLHILTYVFCPPIHPA